LTVTAVIFFVIAIILDLTHFGREWVTSWSNFSFTTFLLILAIIVITGLLLGLIIFPRRKYKQRLLLTFPIAFIVFSISDISTTVIGYYGLNEQYNYFSAKRDISNGKVQILDIGLRLATPNVDWYKQQEAEKITANHFGYRTMYVGCTVTDGICIYNSVMENHLEMANGKNWRVRERQMLDSIMNDRKHK